MNRQPLKIFYFFTFMNSIGIQMFSAISYIYLEKQGFTFVEINLYLSVFWLVCMITEIPSGILVDTIGIKKVLSFSYFTRGVGLLLLVLSKSFYMLCIVAVLTALAESASSGTLESWIANKLDISMKIVLSRVRVISPILGMLFGYIGSDILGNISLNLPFIISSIIFFILTIVAMKTFPKVVSVPNTQKNAKIFSSYREVIFEIRNAIKNIKNFWLWMGLLMLPVIIDVGPSNQWQILINSGHENIITGRYNILIALITVVVNLIIAKFSTTRVLQYKYLAPVLWGIDALIICFLPLTKSPIILFLVHVFLFGAMSTFSISFVHDVLVKNNSTRTSILSIFYSLEAVVVSILLMINGMLSDHIAIQNVWAIFSLVGIIFAIMLVIIFLFVNRNFVKDNK